MGRQHNGEQQQNEMTRGCDDERGDDEGRLGRGHDKTIDEEKTRRPDDERRGQQIDGTAR
jgi:hypothetical protein